MYVRFVTGDRDARSDPARGVFTALGALERQGELAAHEQAWLAEIEAWRNGHLRPPERLAWSSRPNAPPRAILWLKLSAVEHVARLRELVTFLEYKDVPVQELRTDRPGYIVYEDEHQVAAIPFAHETF